MRSVYRNNAVYYALMPGLWLYRHAALCPLAWLLQRTISTPATHFAQPAWVQDDGIGHSTGNYSNLLVLWDVLLGTAHITQRYPTAYGAGLAARRHYGGHSLASLSCSHHRPPPPTTAHTRIARTAFEMARQQPG